MERLRVEGLGQKDFIGGVTKEWRKWRGSEGKLCFTDTQRLAGLLLQDHGLCSDIVHEHYFV